MKKISIIIPLYNLEGLIGKCIASALDQDLPHEEYEVIVVDDGSTDGSLAAAQRAACGHANVQVHAKPNEGVSLARNYGTERAAGRYVMYVDADDYLSPGVLGGLTQIMDRERLDMLCFDMAGVDEHGGDLPLWSDGLFARGGGEVQSGRDFLRRDCFLPMACAYLYDRAMLERHGLGMLPMRHEDEEFTPRVLLQAQRVVLTGQEIYYYDNCRAGSITHAEGLSTRRVQDRLRIYDSLAEIYRTVTPRALRRRLQDDLCWKYLDCTARFDCRTLPGYRPQRLRMLQFACTPRRRAKAALFALSPELFRRVMNH